MTSLAPTVFIFHVYRCESILLVQLLSLDKQNIVLAEPPIFNEVSRRIAFKKPEILAKKKKNHYRQSSSF